jgi:hypothetical protein
MEQFPINSNNIKKILEEESKKTDPTKSSPIPEKLDLEYINDDKGINYRSLKDIETGEIYIEKQDYEMELEHFVALISKGILHVSDVVEKDGEYYSRKMSIENIESSSKEELEAELFMLLYLFGDWDHEEENLEQARNTAKEEGYIEGVFRHKNLVKNENNQFVHFDYGIALKDTSLAGSFNSKVTNNLFFRLQAKKFLHDKFGKEFNFRKFKFESKNKEIDSKRFNFELKKKTSQFQEALNDKTFFKAVLNKSKINLLSTRFSYLKGNSLPEQEELFRKYLLNRISILKDIVD